MQHHQWLVQYSVVVVTLPYAKSCVAWPVHIHPFYLLSSKWTCREEKEKHICKINTCKTGYQAIVCVFAYFFFTRGIHSHISNEGSNTVHLFFLSSIFEGWLNHLKKQLFTECTVHNLVLWCLVLIMAPGTSVLGDLWKFRAFCAPCGFPCF